LETNAPDKPLHPTAKDQVPREFAGDPIYVDSPGIYLGTGPLGSNYVGWGTIPDTGCNNPPYTTSVIPIGIAQVGGGQYLAYGGQPGTRTFPIGVSPDNGCALYLNDLTLCSQTIDWKTVLASLGNSGLNTLRVWVAFGAANDSRNTPFTYHTDAGNCPSGLTPCFRLDVLYQPFFDQVRRVVNEARKHQMFVEITFLSPFWGDNLGATFANGPWGGRGAHLVGSTITPIKFAGSDNMVLDAQSGDNLTMQGFEADVVRKMIDELWCFDSVWYEIANEPEAGNLNPVRVANWEKSLISTTVVPEDSTAVHPLLVRPHLIAVNVSSMTNTAEFIGPNNPNVAILEGHYSEILPGGNLNSGAITFLARNNGGGGKVLGFNETKIANSAQGNSFTRSVTNGTTVAYSGPEPARAEAWEFMLSRGGTMDVFSYLSGPSPGTVGPIAGQMNSLKSFMLGLPIGRLVASTDTPSWVNLDHHPDPANGTVPAWDSTHHSFRYWGALQTPDGTSSPSRVYALYLHHSAPRCKENVGSPVTYDQQTNPACTIPGNLGWLTLGGHDARIWTSSQYQDTFTLTNLGATGTFRLCWIDPATYPAPSSVLKQQTCHWNGTTCDIVVQSPLFQYDIALKMDENVTLSCTQ
jgi:hypothetical protein